MVIHSAPPAFRQAWVIGGGAEPRLSPSKLGQTEFDGRHGGGCGTDYDSNDITESARWADSIEATAVGLLGKTKHEH
jgi:hypothetical protein